MKASCPTLIPLQKKLSTKVEQLRKQVKEKDRELAVKDRCLEEVKKQKGEVNQRLVQIKQTIRQTKTKTIKLIREKMNVEKQLQLREQELQFLRTGHQEDSEQLQNIIRNREEEIRELQQQLHTVEGELNFERKRTQELSEKLQQATTELEKKSAVQRVQEKENEALKSHLKRERQMVDFLQMQLISASSSKDQYISEMEVREHYVSYSLDI